MPTFHPEITEDSKLHKPFGFVSANDGDKPWKNEEGDLEWTDELILPSALNFVDASLAPPTTNNGDIYVLSSGGSVHVDWGSNSIGDWVRRNGTEYVGITPQKGSACYDKTSDSLGVFDGLLWGGAADSVYTKSGTAFLDVVMGYLFYFFTTILR